MTDPDVRVVVQGVAAAERKLKQLVRQRHRVERMAEEARRKLETIARDIRVLERTLGRARRGTQT